jgi:hypothetical protein
MSLKAVTLWVLKNSVLWIQIRIWIRIRVKGRIRIRNRIKVKKAIRIRIRIKVKIHELLRLEMVPWKANNGGVEAQNETVEGLYAGGLRFTSLS